MNNQLAAILLAAVFTVLLLAPVKAQAVNETCVVRLTKINDLNGDGQRQSGEPEINDWKFRVVASDGTTQEIFSGEEVTLSSGEYDVFSERRPWWRLTSMQFEEHAEAATESKWYRETILSLGECPNPIRLLSLSTYICHADVAFVKIHDKNANGWPDKGEPEVFSRFEGEFADSGGRWPLVQQGNWGVQGVLLPAQYRFYVEEDPLWETTGVLLTSGVSNPFLIATSTEATTWRLVADPELICNQSLTGFIMVLLVGPTADDGAQEPVLSQERVWLPFVGSTNN